MDSREDYDARVTRVNHRTEMMNSRSLVFFVESDNPVRLTHLATMMMSAVLLDRPVTVVWMGAALARLMAGELDPSAGAPAAGSDDSGTTQALLHEARVLGGVNYLPVRPMRSGSGGIGLNS